MPTYSPRTPVLVGAGQFVHRLEAPTDALEPLALMVAAVKNAGEDSGSSALLAKADAIWVVAGGWRYHDPGRLIAQQIGATPTQTAVSVIGGNTPQSLVNRASLAIASGALDVVVLAGGEGIYSRRRAKRAGVHIATTDDSDIENAEVLGVDVPMSSAVEAARGLEMPVNLYPIFDNAIRASKGESVDEHRDRIAKLWAGFNKVAVDNPYAWIRRPMTAAQIREATPDNRMVGFPYTKAMNSNWDLDQAAAVILCAAETAESLGISRDRWVFPQAGTDSHDTYHVTNRFSLAGSPAIRIAARRCFELAQRSTDDVAHIDLYSCFPSAVQIAANEIGLDQSRQLTVTGGLSFAGGPLNNYVMHSIATMANVLREHPGDLGLVTANGGYVTKHAIGLYSTEPPSIPFRHEDVQSEVDTLPTRDGDGTHVGAATVESFTVMHGVDGPEVALVAALTPDGRRAWGRSTDPDLIAAFLTDDLFGRPAEIDENATIHIP